MTLANDSVPAWTTEFVGLPWRPHGRGRAGVDCWGLVCLVYHARYGIALPSYADAYGGVGEADAAHLAGLVRGEVQQWRPVQAGAEREGDLVVIRLFGLDCHTGVIVAPGWMLHNLDGTDVVLTRYRTTVWQRRVSGFWRHRERRDD